eukprot:g21708.t1
MPGISLAAVVAVPHPRWDERPVVVVILDKGVNTEGLLDRVREHLSSSFAKFQLPDDVLVWKEIPHTGTGKMDKKSIRAKLEEPRPLARAAVHFTVPSHFQALKRPPGVGHHRGPPLGFTWSARLVGKLVNRPPERSSHQARSDGVTALHLSAEGGHASLVALLCEARAEITSQTDDTLMPLHLAARSGHTACWLHQVHLGGLGPKARRPEPWTGMIGNAVIHDSSERRVKLENVLKRAASGQTLSDKTPANSRRLPVVLV